MSGTTHTRRVVVTGVGCVNAVADNVPEFDLALRDGRCGVREVDLFPTDGYRTTKAAQVSAERFDRIRAEYPGHRSRLVAFCLKAADEAVALSGVPAELPPEQRGVSVATSLGFIDEVDAYKQALAEDRSYPADGYLNTCATLTELLAGRWDCAGPVATVSTACAAGTNSVGIAFDAVRHGEATWMVCGGADPVSRISLSGFNALKSMSSSGRVRSFSADRDGLIIGEGAGILVLEEREHAIARGATILAEIRGYGLANDAYHMTTPDPKGTGAIASMRACLDDAALAPAEVDYINAHGTATPYNDPMELGAIDAVFGDRAGDLMISSIKGMTGHTLGAAGSIELIASVLTLKEGYIPPTINFTAGCDDSPSIRFSPNAPTVRDVSVVLSNSFAFAGNTASIALCRDGFEAGHGD